MPEYSTLVPIKPAGSEAPFFCVHGGEGGTLFLHRLARELGSQQPFYALEAEGLDGKGVRRVTVEEMARHYLSEIRKIQRSGPYYIAGYCFGGLVAFEMAHQLWRQGEPAALVVLFSAPLRSNRIAEIQSSESNVSHSEKSGSRVLRFSKVLIRSLHWRTILMRRTIGSAVNMAVCRAFLSIGFTVPQPLRTMYVVRMIQKAESSYVPKPYRGRLVLFYGRGQTEYDSGMGWDGLADIVEKHEIGEGGLRSRRDIMNEPLVAIVASKLSALLHKAHTTDPRTLSEAAQKRRSLGILGDSPLPWRDPRFSQHKHEENQWKK